MVVNPHRPGRIAGNQVGRTSVSRQMRGHPIVAAEDVDRRLAFDRLYDRHARAVLAFAIRRTASSADAEDVAAETFVVAWRRLDHVPETELALPWLFGVARKVIANHRRASSRRGRLEQRIAEQPRVAEPLVLGEAGSAALTALERLRPEDQELLKLVAWEGLSHSEIAEVLGISANAVAIRLHRARRRYQEAHAGQAGAGEADAERAMKGSRASRTVSALRGRMFGSAGRNEAR